jgi:hypothetical protein
MEPPERVSGYFYSVSYSSSGEGRARKDRKSMFQNLKEKESIYGITQNGP